jgi:nickel-dependent lactate racemase
MPVIKFPYGKGTLEYDVPDSRFRGELASGLHSYRAQKSQEALVEEALANPAGTPRLSVMAEGKKKVVIIASDHTRPVPSKVIIPRMLAELRRGSPDAEISILVATGCHRETSREELINKFGEETVNNEKIVIHDCDGADLVCLGKLPSGGRLVLNPLALQAELLVAEGFIEPHFFAGFSGGRKSILPGIAARETVAYNHNAEFIAHPRARTGVVDGNPIHTDMLYAARAARLAFICNVVLNAQKEVIYAVAGDVEEAHRLGRGFLADKCRIAAPAPADIVITSNGGYPLDQNIYQAVKGMAAAEAAVRQDGVIIMLAESSDGHGSDEFFKTFVEEKNLDRMMEDFLSTPKEKTRPEQWTSQILVRVLKKARVVYISGAQDDVVKEFGMIPAGGIAQGLSIAEEILGNREASILAIPDGVSVIVGSDL